MTCRRDPTLKPGEGVHEVVIRRTVRWSEAQDQMIWLTHQPDSSGHFSNGRRLVGRGDQREEVTWYAFTDTNTAFRFRLQFG